MPTIPIGQSTGSPQDVKVAVLADGNWVAVWNSYSDPDSSRGVYFQVFDRAGAQVSPIKRAHSNYNGDQTEQQVVSLDSGGFVITWNGSSDIYTSVYDSKGFPIATEIRVNFDTGGEQTSPQALALSGGKFVIGWNESKFQIFDGSGERLGSTKSFGIPQSYAFDSVGAYPAASIALSDGGWTTFWAKQGPPNSSGVKTYGLSAQKYNASGDKVGAEISVVAAKAYADFPNLQPASSGSASIVAWYDHSTKSVLAIKADSAGSIDTTIITLQALPTYSGFELGGRSEGGWTVISRQESGLLKYDFDLNGRSVGSPAKLDAAGTDSYPDSASGSSVSITAWATPDASPFLHAEILSSSPSYSVSANQSSVNEGSTATFTVSTTNVASGTSLAYTLSGISAADITGGLLSGTTVVGPNGQATISVPIAADQTTEGNETLTVTVQGKTASTTVSDTSKTPIPVYKITPEQTPIKFGNYAVFNIETQYVSAGTVIPYTIFSNYRDYVYDGVFSGTITVNDMGKAQVRVPITYLGIVTGYQYIKLTLGDPSGYNTESVVDLIPLNNGTRVTFNTSTSSWLHGNTYQISVDTNYTTTPYVKISGTDPKYFGKSSQSDLIFPVALDGSGRGVISIETAGSYIGALSGDLGYNSLTNSSEFTVSLLSSPLGVPLTSSKWSFLEPVIKNVSVSNASIAEGDNLTFTLTSQNLSPNVVIPWSVSGNIDSADIGGGLLTGTTKVDLNGKATVQFSTTLDQKTEGPETLTLSIAGKLASATINDTSTTPATPTYSITANQSSINEGSTATFTVSTTNVASGTSLAYTLSGVSASDITGGSLSGTTTVGSNGQATISVPIAADQTTEGNETLNVTVQGKTALTTIVDTSTTPTGTYALAAGAASVNEGGTASFILTTTNVAAGTSLAYTISGVSASDLFSNSLTGSVSIASGGTTVISIPVLADNLTEGTETMTVSLQGKSASINILDTSTTPNPTYSISSNTSEVSEGSNYIVTLSTTNVPVGTVYPWAITSLNMAGRPSNADFDNGVTEGLVAVDSSGKAIVTLPVKADQLTEGYEDIYFSFYTDTTRTRVLANTAASIKDTSVSGPSYTITANQSSVNEGSTAYFSLTTTNVTIGTSTPYSITGVSENDVVGGLSGSVTVQSSGTTFGIIIFADQTTEGTETLTVTVQGKTASVQILDTSTAPNATYAVQATTVSVAEGSTAQFLLTTTNLAAGTSVAYTLSGVSAADIVGGITSGSVTVAANGQATISVPLAADLTTEGVETLTVTVQGKTASMQVLDTSTAPAPIYSLAAKSSSVDEGGVAEFNVTTTNVAAGTALSYGIKGISSADIVGGALTGTATVDSAGKATISIPIALDLSTEGTETLEVTLEGKSASVSIKDTSLTPQAGYALTAQSSSVNEGDVAVFVLSGTNVAAGTTVSYTLSGVTTSDITGGKLTGSAVLGADGRASISIPIAEDQSTEGQETLTLAAQGQTASIKINDTSLSKATYELAPRAASVNEGVSAIFDLTTTNVPSGTVLSYTITGVSDTDIVGKSLSGSVSIGANGKGVITVPIANDGLTEGAEYLSVLVQGVSAAVMVNDTSKTSLEIPATFTINAASGGFDVRAAVGSEVNTASSLVVKVGNTWTTGFRANAEALLKWHQNPASVGRNTALDGLSTDQALAALDRGLTGSEQSAFITLLGLIADVEIKSGMPTFDGNLVLPAVATPSYQLQALSASVNEGTNAQFQVTTTNVAAGTELGYTLSGQGITSADIIGGQLSGKVIIGSNGQGTISVGLASDQSTEGSETLVVTLEGKQSTISIQDTSIAVALDQVAPVLSGPYPPTTNAPVDKPLVFYFSEPIKAANVSLIKLLGPGNVATSIQLSVSANMLQITPAGMINNTNYGVSIPQGALADLAGNAFAGLTRYDITTVGIQEESGGGGAGGGGGGG